MTAQVGDEPVRRERGKEGITEIWGPNPQLQRRNSTCL
jgi:hypothetical protein